MCCENLDSRFYLAQIVKLSAIDICLSNCRHSIFEHVLHRGFNKSRFCKKLILRKVLVSSNSLSPC